ncbi:MAG: secretin N-terminal domain-containing protein [Verrucomicrobiales bacterium]|nr:secretin N-terminal domain-containing protein [Verrucomicrobiales bacterium]
MNPPANPRSRCRLAGLGLVLALVLAAGDANAATKTTRRTSSKSSRPPTPAVAKGGEVLTAPKDEPAPNPARDIESKPVNVVLNAVPADTAPTAAPAATPPAEPAAPAPAVSAAPSGDAPPVGADRTLYSFKATDLDLKAALAIFARANNLNIVPDREVTGPVTVDVRDLPLNKLMQSLLEAHDYVWENEDGLIRVRAKETREFWIDYLRLSRKGMGSSSATLASGMSSGGGGGGGGGGGASGGSAISLTADNQVNFWVELKEEIAKLLTQDGKDSLAVNMTAGILQITDRPSALKRVRRYLDSLSGSVARQVEIRARIFDVTLRDQFQFGINWSHAAEVFGGVASMGGSTIVSSAVGGGTVRDAAFNFLFQNGETEVLLKALQDQGEVNVISQPRIRVVNNQTAMIKVGTETPFFTSRTSYLPGANGTVGTTLQQDEVNTITVGTILAITPQISSNEWITLDIAPVLTSLVEERQSPNNGSTTAPVLDIKQASTLVRVKNGTTIVIGGLMQDESAKTVRKIPLLGDIPLLGYLFRGKVDYKAKKELVISITPVISD